MERNPKILVVDDDRDLIDLLHRFLSSKGIICDTAASAEKAIAKLYDNRFDAVITDIKMPGMNGIDLTKEILKLRSDIPVLIMTGFSYEYSEDDAIAAGARDFITKPFQLSELYVRLNKMLKDADQITGLNHLAHYDTLTGLPNRKLFLDRLNQTIESASRYNNIFALMFLDINNFKEINDKFGHDSGDLFLKETATRLMDATRGSDTIARIGGDEFTIILSRLEKRIGAEIVAGRIVEYFLKEFCMGKDKCYASVSIGISLYPSDGQDASTLLKKADVAMYSIKVQKKNDYQFYDQIAS